MQYQLETPLKEEDVRKFKIGDVLFLSGIIITARDEAHLRALELHEKGIELPVDFKGKCLYHCGPIMKKIADEWKVIAAGPTTSVRMEIFEDKFIEAFHPAIIIGKGGMGERTAKACKVFGCAYGVFTGGAAVLAARAIKGVKKVYWLEELGMPECLWVFEAENFGPAIMTIDAYGHNLTERLKQKVIKNKERIVRTL